MTCQPACAPFTPSESGQRSHPTYYRGCWHVVSRCLFGGYRQIPLCGTILPPQKEFTTHRAFILHAASLRHPFGHCAIFLTAASRRSLDRVSVPVWLIVLSDQLPIVDLVGRYPANYLMGRRPIHRRLSAFNNCHHAVPLHHRVLAPLSRSCSRPEGRLPTCYSPLRQFTRDIATPFS